MPCPSLLLNLELAAVAGQVDEPVRQDAVHVEEESPDDRVAGWLLAEFKYAVLIIFIIAAIITPTPDVATQCVFAVPMILLYLLGIAVAWIFKKCEVA